MLACAFFFSLLFLSSYAQTNCSDFQFHGKSYDSCSDLHTLNSFIHWNYDLSSGTVDIAFRKSENEHGRWLAWAINPTSTGMVGSQAFVALQRSDGTLEAYTSPINTYGTTLMKGELSFRVHDISAQNINGQVIVFAKFDLPMNGTNIVNHVWQEGPLQNDDTPGVHGLSGDNLKSFGTLDFHSGKTVAITHVKPDLRSKIKIAHRYIGGALLGLATLQVLAHRLRPDKEHKYRVYWNIYHYCTGYGTGSCQLFQGFPDDGCGDLEECLHCFSCFLGLCCCCTRTSQMLLESY